MLAIQAALWGFRGRLAMGVFQTLSAGNMGQFGAPGTGVPAEAVVGDTATVRPSHISAAVTKATGPANLRRRTSAPSLRISAEKTVPDPARHPGRATPPRAPACRGSPVCRRTCQLLHYGRSPTPPRPPR